MYLEDIWIFQTFFFTHGMQLMNHHMAVHIRSLSETSELMIQKNKVSNILPNERQYQFRG